MNAECRRSDQQGGRRKRWSERRKPDTWSAAVGSSAMTTSASRSTGTSKRRINDKEAAIIRRIFAMSAAGNGYSRITKELNTERVVAPRPQQQASQRLEPVDRVRSAAPAALSRRSRVEQDPQARRRRQDVADGPPRIGVAATRPNPSYGSSPTRCGKPSRRVSADSARTPLTAVVSPPRDDRVAKVLLRPAASGTGHHRRRLQVVAAEGRQRERRRPANGITSTRQEDRQPDRRHRKRRGGRATRDEVTGATSRTRPIARGHRRGRSHETNRRRPSGRGTSGDGAGRPVAGVADGERGEGSSSPAGSARRTDPVRTGREAVSVFRTQYDRSIHRGAGRFGKLHLIWRPQREREIRTNPEQEKRTSCRSAGLYARLRNPRRLAPLNTVELTHRRATSTRGCHPFLRAALLLILSTPDA